MGTFVTLIIIAAIAAVAGFLLYKRRDRIKDDVLSAKKAAKRDYEKLNEEIKKRRG